MFSLKRLPVFVNPIFSRMQIRHKVEVAEEIVIVGGGIAGLATSLGLHRMGVRSLVLESSESLRVTGFAFLTWMNAWKAMDALGIGDSLRQQHVQLQGTTCVSATTGLTTSRLSFLVPGKWDKNILSYEEKTRQVASGPCFSHYDETTIYID